MALTKEQIENIALQERNLKRQVTEQNIVENRKQEELEKALETEAQARIAKKRKEQAETVVAEKAIVVKDAPVATAKNDDKSFDIFLKEQIAALVKDIDTTLVQSNEALEKDSKPLLEKTEELSQQHGAVPAPELATDATTFQRNLQDQKKVIVSKKTNSEIFNDALSQSGLSNLSADQRQLIILCAAPIITSVVESSTQMQTQLYGIDNADVRQVNKDAQSFHTNQLAAAFGLLNSLIENHMAQASQKNPNSNQNPAEFRKMYCEQTQNAVHLNRMFPNAASQSNIVDYFMNSLGGAGLANVNNVSTATITPPQNGGGRAVDEEELKKLFRK